MKLLQKCQTCAALLVFAASALIPKCIHAVNSMSDTEESASIVAIDVYDMTLTLKVPQVLENTTSTGYRKFKTQKIKGTMYVKWLSDDTFGLEFANFENMNFKVGGYRVSYKAIADNNVVYQRYNYIGNNGTDVFKTPCICFYLELEPSYAIGGNTEDNSFYILLAGSGTSVFKKRDDYRVANKMAGYVAGTQGCGCAAYTHKSPTRSAGIYGPTDRVDDVVATYGRWKALWKSRVTYSATATR